MAWNRNDPIIQEIYTQSKTGRQEDNEDNLYYGSHFIAVVDGATAKSEALYGGRTGGRLCAERIVDAIRSLDREVTCEEAVSRIYQKLREMEETWGLEEKDIHCCASAVIFSCARREIWSIGDCQYMVDEQLYTNVKPVDRIMSEARAAAIQILIQKGVTEEQLLRRDLGREMILPLLREQRYLENSAAPYGYPVFNRCAPPAFTVCKVPDRCTVVLASDGYPFLRGSLAESERKLAELLRDDPLCYKKYRSTKGLREGNVSFDDRSYIRFSL